MGTRRRACKLDIDEQVLVFVSALFAWKPGAVDLTLAGVGLGGGNVVGAPAFSVLDYSKSIGAEGIAVIGTFSVRLPIPMDCDWLARS